MSVFRVIKNNNYTTVCNFHLRDKRLSLKAKGLLTIMLSLPETWNYSVSGLVSICKEGRTAVEAALKELKNNGYLVVEKLPPKKGERGQFEYVYNVYEVPASSTKLGAGNQPLENQKQLNTNISNGNEGSFQYVNGLDIGSEDDSSKPKTESKGGRFAPPTREEVADYATEKGYSWVDVDRFMAYYESNGWMVGKNKMKSWKAAVTNWALRDKPSGGTSGERSEYDDIF